MNTQNDLIQKYGYFMTVAEVAEFLKLKEQTIYRRISENTMQIPSHRDGNVRRFKTVDVASYYDKVEAA